MLLWSQSEGSIKDYADFEHCFVTVLASISDSVIMNVCYPEGGKMRTLYIVFCVSLSGMKTVL